MNQKISSFVKSVMCLLIVTTALYVCAYPARNSITYKSVVTSRCVQQTPGSGTVPLQLINGLPYIEIIIDGKGPYLFGFDSGFGAEMEIDVDLATDLGIKPTDKTTVGDGSGNTIRLDMGVVNSIEIGREKRQIVNAIIRNSPRKRQPGMENVKGIIGIGMFTNQKVTIDYPKLLFSVEEGYLPIANGKDIFDFTPVGGGVPEIEITVGNNKVRAVIDSRSMSAEFKIPRHIAEKLTYLTEPRVIGKGRTVSSEIDVIEVKIKETIQLGKYVYKEPVITYPSLNESAIIGSKLLKNFVITIDSRNKRIQLVKGEEPKDDYSLSQYTGKYEGERIITSEAGFLYIKRAAGSVLKMLTIGKDEFTIEVAPNAVLKFERDGKNVITAIKITKGDGNWERAVKER